MRWIRAYTTLSRERCECGSTGQHVIYAGFPGWLCDECSTLIGPVLIPVEVHFNGMFLIYDGTVPGYFRALWCFLAGHMHGMDT